MASIDSTKPSVAVIGSGLVGRSWAIVFSRAGYTVKLYDIAANVVEAAIPYINRTCADLFEAGLLGKASSSEEVAQRVHPVTDLREALSGVIWAQECVPENVELKQKAFTDLDAVADPSVILASSSSAIPSSSFTAHVAGRARCLIAHPVNPPHLIPLVELVPAPYTDPQVVVRARSIMEDIGQAPIVVKKEVDSFILNRLQGALLNEAFRLVEDGYISPEDLDKTVRDGLGLRWSFMGPFETIDLNAPGGVKDYVERYGGSMFRLAQQQADARPWQGHVVDEVVAARRAIFPDVSKLGSVRSKWRDARLMALMSQKIRAKSIDEEFDRKANE